MTFFPEAQMLKCEHQPTLVQQYRGSAQVGRNLKEESSDGGSWFYSQQSLEKFCLNALMLNIMEILV